MPDLTFEFDNVVDPMSDAVYKGCNESNISIEVTKKFKINPKHT